MPVAGSRPNGASRSRAAGYGVFGYCVAGRCAVGYAGTGYGVEGGVATVACSCPRGRSLNSGTRSSAVRAAYAAVARSSY